MKKHIILLLLISTFLFLGCTETEGDLQNETNTTEITEDNSNTTLNFFYDPSWDLTTYNEFIGKVSNFLPGLKIEEKCIDIQKFVSNITSDSEELCVDKVGYLEYNENMKLAKELNIQSSFVLETEKGETYNIAFAPISTAFSKSLCEVEPSLEGCDSLPEIPTIPTTLIIDTSTPEDYSEVLGAFSTQGLIFDIKQELHYESDEAKALLENYEIDTIPILMIEPEDYKSLDNEQQMFLSELIGMGYLTTSDEAILMALPGNAVYVGPKYTEANIELFVMSYCPYGLQSEKAILPVKELFGDKLNLTIKFVNYAMHGKEEMDENTLQYCIQKEHPDIFFEYLDCFTLNGDTETCLEEIGMTIEDIQTCINKTDRTYNLTALYEDQDSWLSGRFPKYPVNEEENILYGVRGSPALIFNGRMMSWPRSPEGIKEGICNLLEDPPEECNEELSNDTASPGFGGGVGSSSTGSCA